jgi:PIN domain nuclease of toxin-antitoxin system
MRFLLDTHVWLWLMSARRRLAGEVLEALGDPGASLFLSAASAWEIAIKYRLGKLPLTEPAERYVADRMARSGTLALPITHAHALHVATLPRHHGDPFDRLLVAQAQLEGLELVTADRVLEDYDVRVRWAT